MAIIPSLQDLCLACTQALATKKAVTYHTEHQRFVLVPQNKESLVDLLALFIENQIHWTAQIRILQPTEESESLINYFNLLQRQARENVTWTEAHSFRALLCQDYNARLLNTERIYTFFSKRIQMGFTEAQQQQIQRVDKLVKAIQLQGFVNVADGGASASLIEVEGITHEVGHHVSSQIAILQAAALSLAAEVSPIRGKNLLLSKIYAQRAIAIAQNAASLETQT